MNSKRTNNQQVGASEMKTILSHKLNPFNEENHDPNPNIINATELKMDLVPLPNTNNNRTSQRTTVPRAKMDHSENTAKSYDRTKAKEYIAVQQKKRLLEKKTAKGNTSEVQKDEVKKRLAELHKNSLKIVKKNIAKKQKSVVNLANSTGTVDKGIDKNINAANEPTTNGQCIAQTVRPQQLDDSVSAKASEVNERPTTKSLELLMNVTPRKRGILRRNEPFDGPLPKESQPHLDKTIINSLLQTMQKRKSNSLELNKFENGVNNHLVVTPTVLDVSEMKLKIPQSELKSSVLSSRSSKSRSKSWDSSRSSVLTYRRSGSTRVKGEAKTKMPYWLKPTSAHAYPYNFIMAVRKKLESVTQPLLVDPVAKTDTPLARPKISRKMHSSNFRENLNKFEQPREENYVAHDSSKAFLDMIDSIPSIKDMRKSPNAHKVDDKMETHENNHLLESSKQPFSGSEEFSTNFSSISLHITDRNTMSELSSIRSEQPNHPISPSKFSQPIDMVSDGQDDTTISSAILSQSSPEKKATRRALFVEPLTTEGIDDLKISSTNISLKPTTPRLHPFINTRRGDITPLSEKSDLNRDLDQRSMVEMFETFSKNLSQVISVNERLHTALSRQSNISARDNSSEVKTHIIPDVSLVEDSHVDLSSKTVEKSNSVAEKTETEPAYTTSFEVTNESIPEEEVTTNSRTNMDTIYQQSSSEISEEGVKELSTTKTVSEQQSGSVLVTTTIDTQTVTSRKTEILAANESVRSIDPEFRKFSDASSIIGSDIFAVFSHSDEEHSVRSMNQTILSEESFNYSRIGMFEQLINNEKQKSEHLSKLMKIREKSLVDRTKGQIAWLELQKQKYKEKGLTDRISAVKKKQRALLMHMAAERANILKLNKLQLSPKSQRSSAKFKFQNFSTADVNVKRSSVGNELNSISQRSAFRAYEINGTTGLEQILRKREEELQKRRNHVEHLLQWHQRLNREENDVMEMERMLMAYTGASAVDLNRSNASSQHSGKSPSRSPRKHPSNAKKIENIEKSLQLLHDMSSTSVTTNGEEIEDVVEASGKRLNKLWRRLTGEDTDKFNIDEHYKLNKFDLENMYEEAKEVVITKFNTNKDIGPLMDQSQTQSIIQMSTDQNTDRPEEETSTLTQVATDEDSQNSVIPSLDLNFSQESNTDSIQLPGINEVIAEGNGDFYFNDVEAKNTPDEDILEAINEKPLIESVHDNTDIISVDNNSASSQYSFNENIDEISFPNLRDVTSLEHSNLNDTDEKQSVDDSVTTKAQTTSSPSDVIISDNVVMAEEFDDNELSDKFEQDSTSDKSLQLQQSSSDESERITKSNQTTLSGGELSEEIVNEDNDSDHHTNSSDEIKSIGLEQRLIDLDDSLKELSDAIDRAPVMEINCSGPSIESVVNGDCPRSIDEEKADFDEVKMVRNKIINETFPTSELIRAGKHDESYHSSGKSASLIRDYVSPAGELKMPDIISEAEVLRRQQLQIEQEMKHIDQTVPVVFLREIPNKPPPPYVPPAHDTPIITIPPTEERIKEIVYRRINELYNTRSADTSSTEKFHSILSEDITNVYERIILDVCKECIAELDIDPCTNNSMKFKQPLAFYNPPNRLEYVQEFALKKVKKLLDPNSSDMVRSTQMGACVKRKRDLVDEMLVMEMMEDESKWINFDLEEKEVIENIVEQIVLIVVNDAVDDAAIWQRSKTSVLKNDE